MPTFIEIDGKQSHWKTVDYKRSIHAALSGRIDKNALRDDRPFTRAFCPKITPSRISVSIAESPDTHWKEQSSVRKDGVMTNVTARDGRCLFFDGVVAGQGQRNQEGPQAQASFENEYSD